MQCLPILFYQYSIRAHARVHVYMLYLFVESVSCFIFMFQLIENQTFQEMNIGAQCFIFGFNVSFFIYHTPFQKTQWEKNKTPMGAI